MLNPAFRFFGGVVCYSLTKYTRTTEEAVSSLLLLMGHLILSPITGERDGDGPGIIPRRKRVTVFVDWDGGGGGAE